MQTHTRTHNTHTHKHTVSLSLREIQKIHLVAVLELSLASHELPQYIRFAQMSSHVHFGEVLKHFTEVETES